MVLLTTGQKIFSLILEKHAQTRNRCVSDKFCHDIDTFQLRELFGKSKTSKGCGNDGIASCFLKMAPPVISESLCDIFNLSIATGCFPDSWKIARVVPISKWPT